MADDRTPESFENSQAQEAAEAQLPEEPEETPPVVEEDSPDTPDKSEEKETAAPLNEQEKEEEKIDQPAGTEEKTGEFIEKPTAGEEDEIGISLSDDELWDEGTDLDEIPLFEDEEEEEEKEEEVVEEGLAEPLDTMPEGEADSEEELTNASAEEESVAATDDTDPDKQDPDQKFDELEEEEDEQAEQPGLTQWIPWIITGVAAILLFTGIAVLCALWPASDNTLSRSSQARLKNLDNARATTANRNSPPGRGMESINLEPFLIPAQQHGELVFFKLHVELIVPDIQTKKALLLKEAWVRDAIYQELKGINVPAGKGNLLTRYRRPIIQRLNREFRPLLINDIRLSGYLLR